MAMCPVINESVNAGRKDDYGKTRVGLMLSDFPRALLAVSEVATFGAAKYTPSGWKHVEDGIARYNDALGRHLMARHFEKRDRESHLMHLAHAAWNVLAVLELEIQLSDEERKEPCS